MLLQDSVSVCAHTMHTHPIQTLDPKTHRQKIEFETHCSRAQHLGEEKIYRKDHQNRSKDSHLSPPNSQRSILMSENIRAQQEADKKRGGGGEGTFESIPYS